MIGYLYLALAIGLELVGTTCLKYSEGFTKVVPTLLTIVMFSACFFFLSKSLASINLSVAYASWSCIGIVAITLISFFVFGERISLIGIVGIALITIGVLILNLYGSAH